MVANDRHPMIFLFLFNSNHSSIYLRFRDIEDVNFSSSRPLRSLSVVVEPCWLAIYFQHGVSY